MSSKIRLAALGCALLLAALVWAQKRVPVKPPTGPAAEIAGYRQWAKVNPRPARMVRNAAQLCAPMSRFPRLDSAKPQSDNPHLDKFITVYVNDRGRAAMLEQKTPQFPVGSVIVKEKLSAETSAEPELLTVMIRREAGYNPDSGDWEYLVTDGKGEKVTAQGKLETCNVCHTGVKDTGYIFRSYLPLAMKDKLR
jgi:hypothetical protein